MADAGIIGPDAGKSLQLYPRIGVDTRSAATDPDLATDLHWNAVIALTCGQIYLWNVVSACAKTQGDQRCFFQLDIEPQVPYPEGFPVFRPHVTILYKRTSSIADRDWNRFLIKAKVLLSVGPFECKLYAYGWKKWALDDCEMYGLVELLRRAFIEEGGVLYDDPLTPHITWYLQFEKHQTSTIKYDPTIKPQTHLYLNKTGWLILFAITPFRYSPHEHRMEFDAAAANDGHAR